MGNLQPRQLCGARAHLRGQESCTQAGVLRGVPEKRALSSSSESNTDPHPIL